MWILSAAFIGAGLALHNDLLFAAGIAITLLSILAGPTPSRCRCCD
jgi:hypothetical protein